MLAILNCFIDFAIILLILKDAVILTGVRFLFACSQVTARKFEIANDMFWKDGQPFQIIGGDLHYFRVLPEVFL